MKKLLLLSLVFLSFIANAQSDVPPLQVCDDNNDGFAVFNLNSLIPYLLSELANPDNRVISFHLSSEKNSKITKELNIK